jgi:cation:H+ antiporter
MFLLFGLVLLLAGGAALVTGASSVATRLGVSPVVVGLTVLAFGTSAPELVVNVVGALRDETDLAFGNVTGSNLANLGLVLGLAAVVRPVTIEGSIVRRELPLLLLGTTILLVMMLDRPLLGEPPILSPADGIILLLLFSIFVYITVAALLFKRQDPLIDNVIEMEETLPPPTGVPLTRSTVLVLSGIVGLALGGHMTVVNGSALAASLGVSPVIIGMLIVGVGTSLPELVTSAIAAARRECDLCVGNVIGSNIFNSLVVLPVSAILRPLSVPAGGLLDVFVALVAAAIILPIFFFGRASMGRPTGALFMLGYFLYMWLRATTS